MSLILPANWCLIFFRDPDRSFSSAQLKRTLDDTGLTVSGETEPFSVRWGEGPLLQVSIQREAHLETVVRGLVGKHRKYSALIPGVDAQIKIEAIDLDEVLDEINTLIEVQVALQDATSGLMYMSWNQNFSAPGE